MTVTATPPAVLLRRGRIEETSGDGRELVARIFPYDVVRTVADEVDGRLDRYREAFAPGAARPQIDTPALHRAITLRDLHGDRGVGGGRAGYALDLTDDAGGPLGRFRVLPHAYDDVAQMIEDGIDGVSVGFVAVRSRAVRDASGEVRRRLRVLIEHVALEPIPAYDTARVLTLRAGEATLDPFAADLATPHLDDLRTYIEQRKATP